MSSTARHRHPSYHENPAKNRCGEQVIVRSDGKFQQRGKVRRKCIHCRKRLRSEDLR